MMLNKKDFDNNAENIKKPNIWLRGKRQMREFYNIKMKRFTSFKTFIFGLLLAVICLLPLIVIMLQYISVFKWSYNSLRLFLAMSFLIIMVLNGLSNMFTIKISKCYASDMDNLQSIEDKAIFVYQILNPGFGIFVLVIFYLAILMLY